MGKKTKKSWNTDDIDIDEFGRLVINNKQLKKYLREHPPTGLVYGPSPAPDPIPEPLPLKKCPAPLDFSCPNMMCTCSEPGDLQQVLRTLLEQIDPRRADPRL